MYYIIYRSSALCLEYRLLGCLLHDHLRPGEQWRVHQQGVVSKNPDFNFSTQMLISNNPDFNSWTQILISMKVVSAMTNCCGRRRFWWAWVLSSCSSSLINFKYLPAGGHQLTIVLFVFLSIYEIPHKRKYARWAWGLAGSSWRRSTMSRPWWTGGFVRYLKDWPFVFSPGFSSNLASFSSSSTLASPSLSASFPAPPTTPSLI